MVRGGTLPSSRGVWQSSVLQGEASSASVCSDLVDVEALMQPWPPEQAAHIRASSLPDPKQVRALWRCGRSMVGPGEGAAAAVGDM